MDWQERMNRALAWVEAHLMEEIEWERAAREASCSLFHFLRMFEVITGITAGEYVRRRRLSLAAMELASSDVNDVKIIEVALRYGYDSPDAFAKAFRKLFGCTPSEARAPGVRLRSYPPIAFTVALTGGYAMEYRIESKPAYSMTGVATRTSEQDDQSFRDLPAFWARLGRDGTLARLERLVPVGSRLGVAGVATEFDLDSGAFTYLAAIETPTNAADRAALPPGCREVGIPAATWGIFDVRGALPEAIHGALRRIFTEWVPSANWEHAPGPTLEIYPPGDERAPDYRCEVWIPLQRPARQERKEHSE